METKAHIRSNIRFGKNARKARASQAGRWMDQWIFWGGENS